MQDKGEYKKSIVFFSRHEIDLDHLTPVMWRLRALSGIEITLLVFHPTRSYQGDWRVEYLRSLGVNTRHVTELIGLGKFVRWVIASGPKPKRPGKFLWLGRIVYNRLIWSMTLNHVNSRIACLDPLALFREIGVLDSIGLLVFDPSISEPYTNLCNWARSQKIPTVAICHGGSFGAPTPDKTEAHIFDFLMLAENFDRSKNGPRKGTLVIGEPRFDRSWVEKIGVFAPPFVAPPEAANCLRVVIMVGKTKYGWFDEERLDEAVDVLSHTPGLHTVMKAHPRDIELPDRKRAGVTVADQHVSSASLIRWADLLLFTESSIALDAVVLDKPVGYLKFLVKVPPFHDVALNMSWNIESIGELIKLVKRLRTDSSVRTYTAEERKKCLSVFVEPVGSDVLGLYSQELLAILGGGSKTSEVA